MDNHMDEDKDHLELTHLWDNYFEASAPDLGACLLHLVPLRCNPFRELVQLLLGTVEHLLYIGKITAEFIFHILDHLTPI